MDCEKEVLNLLMTADKNGDGELSASELEEFMKTIKCPMLKHRCQEFIKKYDKNNDGSLDVKELAACLAKH
ncbi:hypothetical protein PHET_02159 [Paragonimus heterotremus]|uniref:EF-hand domain-containing protein n=1 Tax=Paragonimus heterotremus TaxID=100268 RepID=A0A8J4SQZ9_9TREM|nr:hypothetical protein PHET_02159 [Paragonimus heterotremus]